MDLSAKELKLLKSMIGFSVNRIRGGVHPCYRNRFCVYKHWTIEMGILDDLEERGIVKSSVDEEYVWYRATEYGLEVLEGYLDCKIELT